MQLKKIRNYINSMQGKNLTFRYNGSRNLIYTFEGKIVKCYKSVFLIKINDDDVIKSFSYADIFIGSLEIIK